MDDFRKKTQNTFVAIRDDVDQFKGSMNDWIMFLNHEIRDAKIQVRELERRVRQLQAGRKSDEFEDANNEKYGIWRNSRR